MDIGVYFFRPGYLICYCVYFIVNGVIYLFIARPLAKFLTRFENHPTSTAFNKSYNGKLYFFAIGVELIGPIDLVFIQSAAKTECFARWCFFELESYAHARYLIILGFICIQGIILFIRYFYKRSKDLKAKIAGDDEDEDVKLKDTQGNDLGAKMPYLRKIKAFLQFVY